MPDSKIRIQKATSLLREDHEKVKKLFAEYEKIEEGEEDQKNVIFEQINQELTIHATIEEEIFYPALEAVSKGKKEGEEIVAEALEEHNVVKTLLAELTETSILDKSFDAKMKVLEENVLHHAEEEQEEMFPLFDELDRDEQDRISMELADRKRELNPEE